MAVRSSPLGLTVLALLLYKPLHPYGMQRLIKDWGKDQVVNVGQRTSLYRTIDRLTEGGLIRVRATERDQAYPERTVYEITDEGRATARAWLDEMLATPRRDYPEFPAALSNLLMIAPAEALSALERRAAKVDGLLAEHDRVLARNARENLDRVAGLETEYARAVTAAEHAWLRGVIDDLRSGTLTWTGATP
ncbi:PadR family transcriptional regulator [Actinomadura logoneensis]|uniref:PadR family transcriptional regulator n=1 Tax=Actinomadura logoneensis TaxID=2293572 RepID=A0A372JIQ5_9ACTN|nr:PadR family transcriptional regulator [Actinomadura logoneensis]RFU39850.1 PadR family transcriptional regulator [Actinomadura logoneensis]